MFRWILFWRFKRGQRAQKRDVLAVTEPARIGVPEERRDAPDWQGKDTETVTVGGSNTALALGAQNIVDDSECKLVLVRPAPLSVIAQSAKERSRAAAIRPKTSGSFTLPTAVTRSASLGRPRLTAPDLILGARCARFPVRQIQPSIAAAKLGSAQLRSSTAQE